MMMMMMMMIIIIIIIINEFYQIGRGGVIKRCMWLKIDSNH
jgi:hypothetical protein